MLTVDIQNMSQATRQLVGFGSTYFKPAIDRQTTIQKIKFAVIGRIYALALSFLLHTIATYHAARASISSLSRANPEEIKKCKRECNAAFRASINALFARFNPKISCSKQKKIHQTVVIKQEEKESLFKVTPGLNMPHIPEKDATFTPKVETEVLPILDSSPMAQHRSISGVLSPALSITTSLYISSDSECPTPPRSSSAPLIASPKAQKIEREVSTEKSSHLGSSLGSDKNDDQLIPAHSGAKDCDQLSTSSKASSNKSRLSTSDKVMNDGNGGWIVIKKRDQVLSDCGSDGWDNLSD